MANVLVVDDDADILDASVELLESAGHHVRQGTNGAEGLESLDSGPHPDCILMDVDMPVMTGPGMAYQMLLHDAGQEKIPILLVSARDDLEELARRMGTPYFLSKTAPEYGKDLLRILDTALRQRQAPTPPA